MLDDVLIIDGVLHGYHFDPANRTVDGAQYAAAVSAAVYGFHAGYTPAGETRISQWQMDNAHDADFLADMMFRQSHTDVAVFHGLPMFGWFTDGGSPLRVAKEMRERWPGRVLTYGPISAHQPGALDSIDQMVEELGIIGLKFYPVDLVDGSLRTVQMNDPELLYPFYERAQKRGIKVIAMHKAVPMGPVPLAPYRPDDVDEACFAFPELAFEVVHGGFAFLDETALQVARFDNVYVNLEGTSALLVRAPRKFARVVAEIARYGRTDRIIWGTGAPVIHPRSFEEAMWRFQLPADMTDGEGVPPLTDEDRRGILAGNFLRMHGLDARTLRSRYAGDEFDGPRNLQPAWAGAQLAGAGS
jgi:predicted TIM-barrel fold metal-dependent hydrolase